MNLAAIDLTDHALPDARLHLRRKRRRQSGGHLQPRARDLTIYVIDVSAGDKIPRKGGPGITRSDLLVINKIDLAPMVGASLEVMQRDTLEMRGERPFVFTNIKERDGLDIVEEFIVMAGMLEAA